MSHKALIGLVVVSIALNLLLAGLIGGHMLREGRPSPPPLAWAFKEVPPSIKEKVHLCCKSTGARSWQLAVMFVSQRVPYEGYFSRKG